MEGFGPLTAETGPPPHQRIHHGKTCAPACGHFTSQRNIFTPLSLSFGRSPLVFSPSSGLVHCRFTVFHLLLLLVSPTVGASLPPTLLSPCQLPVLSL